MSLVEKCWMVTSKISVIALLMITGIYFGKFVCPYIKKKKGAVLSLYKKEKRGCGSQYCLYYDYACFIYDSATD